MFFQLKELILWPRSGAFQPQRIRFELGALNVITGVSRTGKSAVIPIIDYCLGSDRCAIPVTTIRDYCSWFGLLVSTTEGDKLIARREPGDQKSTSDAFLLEGETIEVPQAIIEKNTTVDTIKHVLDRLAGLTDLEIGKGQFAGRPSSRDLVAFNFQPQSIIANQNLLFYRTETHEHREKLRVVFPYVLDALSAETLAAQQQLAELRLELQRKQRELEKLRAVSARWVAEIHSWASDARELGLLGPRGEIEETTEELLRVLRGIADGAEPESHSTEKTISAAVDELVGLQREEREATMEWTALRSRFAEMSRLREAAAAYSGSLGLQRERLEIATWLSTLSAETHGCPICGSTTSSPAIHQLLEALQSVENDVGAVSGASPSFDREFERVRVSLRAVSERVEGVRLRIRLLTRRSSDARERHEAMQSRQRFLGNLEQALRSYDALFDNRELLEEVQELATRVQALDAFVAEKQVREKSRLALQRVAALAGQILPKLDVERPNDPIRIVDSDLTVAVAGKDREDFLWEIGSASNWLSYHIAVSLALQKYFQSLTRNPVASFLVYDQPSQAYFPKQLRAEDVPEGADVMLTDEDQIAVRQIYEVVAQVILEADGRLQALILDHAADSVWGGITGLHVAAEWRGGNKLVPSAWFTPTGVDDTPHSL
jgi:hypothetical protein